MGSHVYIEGAAKVDAFANGAFDVFVFSRCFRDESLVVGAAHVPGEASRVDESLAALGARLGFGVVDFSMPSEFLSGVEDITAGTNVVFCFLP